MTPDEFRRAGHELVDRIAEFLADASATARLPRGETPGRRSARCSAGARCRQAAPRPPSCWPRRRRLLFDHSLFNGHPRFMGYITSSAAPIGMLADLLAAAVNPNVGGWELSPMASEIEAQTVRWVAELVGYPADCGGLLVSGGNMANFVCFLAGAARHAGRERPRATGLAGADARSGSTSPRAPTPGSRRRPTSSAWAPTPSGGSPPTQRQRMRADRAARAPSGRPRRAATGRSWWWAPRARSAPARWIRSASWPAICREERLWFHVDGAYGAPAAVLPDAPDDLQALAPGRLARGRSAQVALRAARGGLRAGARAAAAARGLRLPSRPTTASRPREKSRRSTTTSSGLQNSRGFRALKVWLGLRQAGREGYVRMIGDDCRLAAAAPRAVARAPRARGR